LDKLSEINASLVMEPLWKMNLNIFDRGDALYMIL
jgi:hypothetical protein